MKYYRVKVKQPGVKREFQSLFVYSEDMVDKKLKSFKALHMGGGVKLRKVLDRNFSKDEVFNHDVGLLGLGEFKNRVLKLEKRREA